MKLSEIILQESSSKEVKRIALRAIVQLAKYLNISRKQAKQYLINAANELGDLE